jgi:hypothetical protein
MRASTREVPATGGACGWGALCDPRGHLRRGPQRPQSTRGAIRSPWVRPGGIRGPTVTAPTVRASHRGVRPAQPHGSPPRPARAAPGALGQLEGVTICGGG